MNQNKMFFKFSNVPRQTPQTRHYQSPVHDNFVAFCILILSLSVNNLSISSADGTWKRFSVVTIVRVACKWCVPSAPDVFLSKNDNSGGKTREAFEEVEYDFYFTEYDICPMCSDFYPLSNQINLFIVIKIWVILKSFV
jgi:hypothetical protein